jgi:uncharacterized membrane protein SpoIIM required for sporulation
MDIDRYIALNEPAWQRLDELVARAGRPVTKLSTDELDELVRLYQRTSAQLSHVRTHFRDAPLADRLTMSVARARAVIYAGKRQGALQSLATFFSLTFPAALYRARWFVLVSALLTFGPAIGVALWLLSDPAALEASGTASERQVYVNDLFEQYYSDRSPWQFFGEVTLNNVWVAFLTFAGAATIGAFSVTVLASNGWYLGQTAAWMHEGGSAERFWGFILPHGMLELSAIVVAGAAALQLAWAIIAPGDRSRGDALREVGQQSAAIVLGVIAWFVVAGLVEGFVTGRGFPPAARIGIGAIVWFSAVIYIVIRGGEAVRRGVTGALGGEPRTWQDEPTLTPAR